MDHSRLCVFAERHDPRCADRMTLAHLQDAFRYCVGESQACPIYQRIVREMREATPVRAAARTA